MTWWPFAHLGYTALAVLYVLILGRWSAQRALDFGVVTVYFMYAVLFAWETMFPPFWIIFGHLALAGYFLLSADNFVKIALVILTGVLLVFLDIVATMDGIAIKAYAWVLGGGWLLINTLLAAECHARPTFRPLWIDIRSRTVRRRGDPRDRHSWGIAVYFQGCLATLVEPTKVIR